MRNEAARKHFNAYGAQAFAGHTFGGMTGVMNGGIAANAAVAVFQYPNEAVPGTGTGVLWIPRIHLHFVCLTTFTTPIETRSLVLRRGTGDDLVAGGAAIEISPNRNSTYVEPHMLIGRFATNGAVATPAMQFEGLGGFSPPYTTRGRVMLSHVGNAGADYDEVLEMDTALEPGWALGVFTGQAFSGAGTWQLAIKGVAYEVDEQGTIIS